MIGQRRVSVLALALALASAVLVGAGVSLGASALGEASSPSAAPPAGIGSKTDERRAETGRSGGAATASAAEEPAGPEALEARFRDLRAELLTMADVIRAKEQTIADQRLRIETLAARHARLLEGVAERRRTAAQVLFALQGVARVPPMAILARSNGPIDVVRSGVVLSTVVDDLTRRAEIARADSERIALAEEAAAAERRSLAAALDEAHAARERLAVVLGDTAEVGQRLASSLQDEGGPTQDEGGRVPDLIAETRDITVALSALTAAGAGTPQPTPALPSDDAMAALSPPPRAPGAPVAGRIVVNFGDASEGGAAAKGVRIETPPGAQVVAPSSGRVAFVGPFRGYGLLLIVEHGDGYHSLMAGFERIDVTLDQEIGGGDPIGVMSRAPEAHPSLYIELRREGQPVNPLPWVEQVIGKANG